MPRIGKPDLKETLAQAGLRCFARRGYHATTLDEIAAEAQVTKGAVYWHYKDKRELFTCVVEERARILVETVNRAVERETEPCGQLRAFLESVFAFYAENPEFTALLGVLRSGPDSGLGDSIAAALRDFYRQTRSCLGQIIGDGIARGVLEEGPPEALATWLMAVVDGVVLQWGIDPERLDLRAMTPLLVARALRGLMRPAGTP
jgi:AcrR family transcriptional regulator